jgi:hypothetical protein
MRGCQIGDVSDLGEVLSSPSQDSVKDPSRCDDTSSTQIVPDKICAHCCTKTTSVWRPNPLGGGNLCDPCGNYLKRCGVSRPPSLFKPYQKRVLRATTVLRRQQVSTELLEARKSRLAIGNAPKSCSNCLTTETRHCWRFGPARERLCNACGWYLERCGVPRPVSHTLSNGKKLSRRYHSNSERDRRRRDRQNGSLLRYSTTPEA